MNPEHKSDALDLFMYQERLLELIAQGLNTRSAKRKIEREDRKGLVRWTTISR